MKLYIWIIMLAVMIMTVLMIAVVGQLEHGGLQCTSGDTPNGPVTTCTLK